MYYVSEMEVNGSMGIKLGMRRAAAGGRGRAGGFALIVTVSLLTLLALVAVGLLSLSAITVRGGTMEAAQAEARANARLGLMMAMAALQRDAGLDTRVTAPAGILDDGHPALTGVWKSWEGSDHLTSGRMAGRPEAPDYDAKERPASGGGRFLSWLVSGAGRDAVVPGDAGRLVRGAPFAGSVPLVSDGTLAADDERAVHVAPVELDGARGAYAWWVSGENQKARLPEPYKPENDDAAGWSVLAKSHAVADPSVFGLDRVLDHPEESRKALSLATTNLLAGADPGEDAGPARRFHDLSTVSVGLLTNTATGGWRKDLSLLTENWDRLSPRGLAVFGLEPGESATMDLPRNGSHRASGSILYPWSSYRADASRPPIYQHGAVATWHHLMDYATFYQRVRVGRDGQVAIPSLAAHITNASDSFNFLHRIRTVPVVARVHWVFSHYSVPRAGATGDGTHEVQLLLNPVMTMWNPYNVAINARAVRIRPCPRTSPCAFRYHGHGDSNPESLPLPVVRAAPTTSRCRARGSSPTRSAARSTWRPERPASSVRVRRFRAPRTARAPCSCSRATGPARGTFSRSRTGGATRSWRMPSARIRVSARFDTAYLARSEGGRDLPRPECPEERPAAPGLPDGLHAGDRQRDLRVRSTRRSSPSRGGRGGRLSAGRSSRPSSARAWRASTHLAAKGFVQSSPLVNYTAMGGKDEVEERPSRRHYGGTGPSGELPLRLQLRQARPGRDSRLPNASRRTAAAATSSPASTRPTACRAARSRSCPPARCVSLAELQQLGPALREPDPALRHST